jgi:hypothetical protein
MDEYKSAREQRERRDARRDRAECKRTEQQNEDHNGAGGARDRLICERFP